MAQNSTEGPENAPPESSPPPEHLDRVAEAIASGVFKMTCRTLSRNEKTAAAQAAIDALELTEEWSAQIRCGDGHPLDGMWSDPTPFRPELEPDMHLASRLVAPWRAEGEK